MANKDINQSVQRTAKHHAIVGILKQLPLDFENKSGCDRMDIPSAAVAIEDLFNQSQVNKTCFLVKEYETHGTVGKEIGCFDELTHDLVKDAEKNWWSIKSLEIKKYVKEEI